MCAADKNGRSQHTISMVQTAAAARDAQPVVDLLLSQRRRRWLNNKIENRLSVPFLRDLMAGVGIDFLSDRFAGHFHQKEVVL